MLEAVQVFFSLGSSGGVLNRKYDERGLRCVCNDLVLRVRFISNTENLLHIILP